MTLTEKLQKAIDDGNKIHLEQLKEEYVKQELKGRFDFIEGHYLRQKFDTKVKRMRGGR